jgi:FAD:protein FMN transferase
MKSSDFDNNLGYDFTAMACPCEVRIAGLTEGASEGAAHAAIAEVQRIEHKYSRYRGDSIVSQINAAAGTGKAVEVDEETAQLLSFAQALHVQSEGLFDITSGVLRQAWDFKAGRLPTQQAISHILPLVNMHLCTINIRNVYLTTESMQIDFGGFGKEYAADRAAHVLHEQGVKHGFVNLGGDIHVLGPLPTGEPWSIGIAHPRKPEALVAEVKLYKGAVATSGDSERYMEVEGKRYCHVLSPKTGWPAQGWQSISVIAANAVMAGALTTIAMLKEAEAINFLKSYGLPYLAVRSDGELLQFSPPVNSNSALIGRFHPTL